METLTVGPGGELTLPAEFLLRHGMKPEHPIRVIETKGGVLLVPLGEESVSEELAAEIGAWQELAAESWSTFPYEEIDR